MAIGNRRRHELRAAEASRIHRAAVELVDSHGFDAVTVTQISERAAVSVDTFFSHFPDRGAAVIAEFLHFPDAALARFRFGWGFHEIFVDLAMVTIDGLAERCGGKHETLLTLIDIVAREIELLPRVVHELACLESDFGELVAERLELPVNDRRVQVVTATFLASLQLSLRRWSSDPEHTMLYNEILSCAEELDSIGAYR